MNIVLYVGNLAKSVSENELRSLFSQAGEVTSLRIMKDEAGIAEPYGFVGMSSQSEADDAVRRFRGYRLSERPLRVGLVRLRRTPGAPLAP